MERKRQKDRNRRLILALLMLLITGITLSTATYAWFSANTVVTTEDIDIKVEASSGISIAADALTFGKSIIFKDVIDFAKTLEEDGVTGLTAEAKAKTIFANPEKLNPVTTSGGVNPKFFTGTLHETDDNKVVLQEATIGSSPGLKESAGVKTNYTTGNYMVFDVYLRSNSVQNIRFSKKSTLTSKVSGGDNAKLESALRVGVQFMGNTPAISQTTAIGLNDKEESYIWNVKPYTRHLDSLYAAYGTVADADRPTCEATNGYMAGIQDTGTSFIKYYYSDNEGSAYFTKIDSTNDHYLLSSNADEDYAPTNQIFTVQPGINKVRLYVWLEGQDIDCVDFITFSEGLTLNLSFEVIKAAAGA